MVSQLRFCSGSPPLFSSTKQAENYPKGRLLAIGVCVKLHLDCRNDKKR